MKIIATVFAFFLLFFLATKPANASAGISLSGASSFNLGIVKPRHLYQIGQIAIGNTGDSYGCYTTDVVSLYQQTENIIPGNWVTFSPSSFCLQPNQWQVIGMSLYAVPKTKISPSLKGDYFGYLRSCVSVSSSLGICVASKLTFRIDKPHKIKFLERRFNQENYNIKSFYHIFRNY